MAYRLKLKEPLVKGVRRIASEQLANASARLGSADDPEASVHEARKSLKRTRALLRLVRPGLGEAAFRKANARLRDIARGLSAARDRDVVRALLTELASPARPEASSAKKGRKADPSALAKAAQDLLAIFDASQGAPEKASDAAGLVAEAAREIEAMRRALNAIDLEPANFDTVVAGLTRSHRAGRKALAQVLRAPLEEEPLHELRKAAQAYWRQMVLIQQAWPEACLARGASAKEVADLLGQDHDVALLESLLAGPCGEALGAAQRRILQRHCTSRHEALRGEALPKARLLFAEDSEELAARMRELWEAARAGAAQSAPQSGGKRASAGSRGS